MAYKFNPMSGNLDLVIADATIAKIACEQAVAAIGRIVTTDRNALGNRNFFYDPTACKWVEAGPQIVTDENGNIIVDGDCDA